jgi:hypothetical protein
MAEEEEVEVVPRRFQRRQERLDQLRSGAPQRVRVSPRDDGIRRILKHPAAGAFRSEGSVEWPLDQFTKRRLREGSVIIEQVAEQVAEQADEQAAELKVAPPKPEEPPQAEEPRLRTTTKKPV